MYVNVIFIQDDEDGIIDTLYNIDGIVIHGATEESIQAAGEYLAQWDFGEETDMAHTEEGDNPAGSRDDEWNVTVGGIDYVIAANAMLGYVGMTRQPLN